MILNFGKYQGIEWDNVPIEYKIWLLNNLMKWLANNHPQVYHALEYEKDNLRYFEWEIQVEKEELRRAYYECFMWS